MDTTAIERWSRGTTAADAHARRYARIIADGDLSALPAGFPADGVIRADSGLSWGPVRKIKQELAAAGFLVRETGGHRKYAVPEPAETS